MTKASIKARKPTVEEDSRPDRWTRMTTRCFSSCGQVMLVILGILSLVVSMGLIAGGLVLKFSAEIVAGLAYGALSAFLDCNTLRDFNIPDVGDMAEMPIVDDLGIALIIMGCVLGAITFMACYGALHKNRFVLFLFAAIMCVLVIIQVAFAGLVFTRDSVLHNVVRNNLGDKVKTEYEEKGKDTFSRAVTLMQYQLDCCGFRDWSDYNLTSLPPTCCHKNIIDGSDSSRKQQCLEHTAPTSDYNTQGCYAKLQDKLLDDVPVIALVVTILLILQVLQIVSAVLMMRRVRNDEDNNKVEPVEPESASSAQKKKGKNEKVSKLLLNLV